MESKVVSSTETETGTGKGESPRKEKPQNSIKKKDFTLNSSPSRQGPLSDYSPLKGPASIASFFAPPPQGIKSSTFSLGNSPQKAAFSVSSSPHRIISVSATPSKLSSAPLKAQLEESSESDLTLSEGDDEGEPSKEETKLEVASPSKSFKVGAIDSAANDDSYSFKSGVSRGIPFNLDDGEDSEDENEKDVISTEEGEEESDSDISVIISLPSTDSNEPKQQRQFTRKYVDFSNSEYETAEECESEGEDIPLLDSEEENNQIPVMVFRSNQITIMDSPEKKRAAPLPESKKIEISEIKPIPSAIKPAVVPLKRTIIDAENQNTNQKPVPSPKRVVTSMSISNLNLNDGAPVPAHSVAISSIKSDLNQIHVPIVPLIKSDYVVNRNILPAPDSAIYTRPSPDKKNLEGSILPSSVVHSIAAAALTSTSLIKSKTGFVYDERMLHHFDPHDHEHPEKPARISSIYERLRAAKLLDRSQRIPVQVKLPDFAVEVQSVHDIKYCRLINQTSIIKNIEELNQVSSKFNSVYINTSTALAATVAASATIELCQAIGRGDIENGFAIVRPPGHHAEHTEAMGFCIYNNCAVAASSLIRKNLARKILILDWDVHHGNGTQNAFAENGDVLYVSLHRYDGAKFYPHMEEASHTYVGFGAGLGKSVNVAWNGPGFGDADYLYAFNRLIMPIAQEFNPDFVIVSAGFDAAAGDPIGECELTTFGYSMMLQDLMTLAGGKVAVVLEGGYNLEVISKCYEACVRTLLKEAPPRSEAAMVASPKAIFSVENSIISLSPYWKCLFPKPAQLSISENTPQFPLSTILDYFWREECKKHFNLAPVRGIFKGCSDSFTQKYINRVLATEEAIYSPDVLIIFAHESGPVHTNNFMSSLCLQSAKINQSQPFLPLLQEAHNQANYSCIDINLPARTWKLKQTALGNELESHELNVLFALLWERLISRSGCKNVFFVASGSPIYSIGHLINSRDIDSRVRGCFFFSSSLFIPIINSTQARSEWYQKHSHVVVPSQEPIKKVINNAAPAFGSCFSAGQWLMTDSAAAVGDYKMDILNFIRTRIQK